MTKPFGPCALCEAPHFLNHAGLCKRCNASAKSAAIREEALHHEEEAAAFLHQSAAEETVEVTPAEAAEEPPAAGEKPEGHKGEKKD